MYPAFNMELEIVRTVLQNEINNIYVCTDLSKNTGVFYTMISIHDNRYRKMITEKLNTERLFFSNSDFIGAFLYEDQLNLVFRYYHENLLSLMGRVYLSSFAYCKKAAIEFLSACAESGADPELGMLLMDERNINITKDGAIQFNYFLDFARMQPGIGEDAYLAQMAQTVFGILQLNYEGKYESPEQYPDELRIFYLKMISTGFLSNENIISTKREKPAKPIEKRGYLKKNFQAIARQANNLIQNSMTAFLTILVVVTVIYAGVQIHSRWRAKKAYESNITYNGIEYIGDVYLGDEE